MADEALVTERGIVVPPAALSWRFSRAGGPGGQHVNTSDSRVELTCDLNAIEAPEPVRARLIETLGPEIRIVAASERSQWRNRQVALEQLAKRLDRAAHRPAPRRASRPSRAAVEERLNEKRRQSQRKAARKLPSED